MAKKAEPAQFITYPGPHAQITLKNVGDIGDVPLDRGVARDARDLPIEVVADLITRKKVRPSTDREIKALLQEPDAKQATPAATDEQQ